MRASRPREDLKENLKHTCAALALVTLSPQPVWPSGLYPPTAPPSPTPATSSPDPTCVSEGAAFQAQALPGATGWVSKT